MIIRLFIEHILYFRYFTVKNNLKYLTFTIKNNTSCIVMLNYSYTANGMYTTNGMYPIDSIYITHDKNIETFRDKNIDDKLRRIAKKQELEEYLQSLKGKEAFLREENEKRIKEQAERNQRIALDASAAWYAAHPGAGAQSLHMTTSLHH